MMKAFLALFAALCSCLVGCAKHLTVHTEYLNRENLASFYVGTPDPLLNEPMIGQRLFVQWSLPPYYKYYSDLSLKITIRFGNRTQIMRNVNVIKLKGMFIYTLANEDYEKFEGIATYKIDVMGDGYILETWYHQLWTNLITIEDKDCEEESS